MDIEERKEEDKIGDLSQSKTVDLFKAIVMGKEVTETIKTSRGNFKVKFPRARDLEEIGRRTAMNLNGIPVRCFDGNTYNLISEIATLDVVVMDGPDWYRLAKRDNDRFSWAEIPDDEFISEVYAEAYKFRTKVQEEIKGNKNKGHSGMDALPNSSSDTQPGLFEGMSGEYGSNG